MLRYPTREEQRKIHEKAQDKLEDLRSKVGDENFIRFIMQVLANSKGYVGEVTPNAVVEMCDKAAKLLLLYIKWYLETVERRIENGEITGDNADAWSSILQQQSL